MRTASSAISLSGQSNLTISSKTFADIEGRAIYLLDCTNVLIIDCMFDTCGAGVVAVECTNVTVTRSHYRDIMGNTPGGHFGQFVQLDKVTGGTISYNRGTCAPDVAAPEDIISVYESTGITVAKNRLMGGGPSTTGPGIMLGDSGGSDITCEDNVVIETGAVGIGVAGGSDITVRRNRVYSGARVASNTGMNVQNFDAGPMSSIEVSDNSVSWRNAADSLAHLYDGGDAGDITGWDTNLTGASADVLAQSFHLPPP